MQRTISSRELRSLIDGRSAVDVIDVRKSHDYSADPALIPGARHLLPEQVDDWLDELARDREVIVYCVHGHAVSNTVLDRLLSAGYRARLVDGGLEAWKQAGGETVAG